MSDPTIVCPVCKGRGEADSEARRYRVGMNFWVERACTCCHGDGRVTVLQYHSWLANKRHEAREVTKGKIKTVVHIK